MDAVIDWGAIAQNLGGFLFAVIFLGWILARREGKMTDLWTELFKQNHQLFQDQQDKFAAALDKISSTVQAQQVETADKLRLIDENREGIQASVSALQTIQKGIDEIIGFHKIESRLKELEEKVSNSKTKGTRGVYD